MAKVVGIQDSVFRGDQIAGVRRVSKHVHVKLIGLDYEISFFFENEELAKEALTIIANVIPLEP